jgi:hypothetical protein
MRRAAGPRPRRRLMGNRSMEIVDGQVHIGVEGVAPMLAQMDALGIAAALLDEFWFRNDAGQQMPGYELAGGAWRCVGPIAEQAALLHPGRFAYLLRVNRRDPELKGLIGLLAPKPSPPAPTTNSSEWPRRPVCRFSSAWPARSNCWARTRASTPT